MASECHYVLGILWHSNLVVVSHQVQLKISFTDKQIIFAHISLMYFNGVKNRITMTSQVTSGLYSLVKQLQEIIIELTIHVCYSRYSSGDWHWLKTIQLTPSTTSHVSSYSITHTSHMTYYIMKYALVLVLGSIRKVQMVYGIWKISWYGSI